MKRFFLQMGTLALCAGNAVAQSMAPSAEATDIRGIRGPVAIPEPQDWSPWVLGISGAAAMAALIWWLLRARKRRAETRVLTARERALAALEAARALRDRVTSRDYAYAVSDTLRRFIEVRFWLPSTRQTTEEFLRTVTERGGALGPYAPTLADFLRFCDLGKFGQWRLDDDVMDAMHASALAVINAELDEPQSANEGMDSSLEEEPCAAPARR